MSKKYFSIHEVSELTGLPAHRLRYAEKAIPKLQIHQIRSRRYYTSKDIAKIKDYYGLDDIAAISRVAEPLHPNILSKIDNLLKKFGAML